MAKKRKSNVSLNDFILNQNDEDGMKEVFKEYWKSIFKQKSSNHLRDAKEVADAYGGRLNYPYPGMNIMPTGADAWNFASNFGTSPADSYPNNEIPISAAISVGKQRQSLPQQEAVTNQPLTSQGMYQPEQQQAPDQQQAFQDYYTNPMIEFIKNSPAFETKSLEQRAKRENQLAKVLAITNAMRSVADVYHNTGDREAPVAQHQDIGVMKAIDDYKQMLDKIDGRTQARDAAVLNQRIRALDLYHQMQEKEKDRGMTRDRWGEQDSQFQQSFQQREDFHEDDMGYKQDQLKSIDDNRKAEQRRKDESNAIRQGHLQLKQEAARNKQLAAEGKITESPMELKIAGNDTPISSGDYWHIIKAIYDDENRDWNNPNDEAVLTFKQTGEAKKETLDGLVAANWKRYAVYDTYANDGKGGFVDRPEAYLKMNEYATKLLQDFETGEYEIVNVGNKKDLRDKLIEIADRYSLDAQDKLYFIKQHMDNAE